MLHIAWSPNHSLFPNTCPTERCLQAPRGNDRGFPRLWTPPGGRDNEGGNDRDVLSHGRHQRAGDEGWGLVPGEDHTWVPTSLQRTGLCSAIEYW